MTKANKTGIRGVCLKRNGRIVAGIGVDGKDIRNSFANIEKANLHRKALEDDYHSPRYEEELNKLRTISEEINKNVYYRIRKTCF